MRLQSKKDRKSINQGGSPIPLDPKTLASSVVEGIISIYVSAGKLRIRDFISRRIGA